MERVSLHSKRGVSLVEPMVAMVVLSFSLLGSVSMFALAQDGITGGARRLQAMALAETRLERLRAAAYHTLLTADLDGDGVVDRQTINGISVTWTVRPDRPSLVNSQTAMITVTASWSDQAGRRRMVRLGMRRANPIFSGGAV